MTEDLVLDPELEDIWRQGLAALAAETPQHQRRRPRLLYAAAAAAVLAVVAAGTVAALLSGDNDRHPVARRAPSPSVTAPAPTQNVPPVIGQQVPYDLPRLVGESARIVVGTVGDVRHEPASDASGGLDYVLATIAVDQTLKGRAADSVVAFDYDYGSTISSGGAGAVFVRGDRVLVFLSDVTGTVHESIRPPHWQVTGGAAGLYRMRGDQPDAPFTLQDVEREAGS